MEVTTGSITPDKNNKILFIPIPKTKWTKKEKTNQVSSNVGVSFYKVSRYVHNDICIDNNCSIVAG